MLIPESSSFSTLIDYFTFASWVFYGATITGLLYMRFSKPDASRPFKVSKTYHLFIRIKYNSKMVVVRVLQLRFEQLCDFSFRNL